MPPRSLLNTLWPTNIPSRATIQFIIQIQYYVEVPDDRPEVIEIYECNIWALPEDQRVEPWETLPLTLHFSLSQLFWRKWLWAEMFQSNDPDYGSQALKKYIKYTGSILERLWKEVTKSNVDEQWCSQHILKWTALEYHVGRHSPERIEEWVQRNGPVPDFDPGHWEKLEAKIERSGFPGYNLLRQYRFRWQNVPIIHKKRLFDEMHTWLMEEEVEKKPEIKPIIEKVSPESTGLKISIKPIKSPSSTKVQKTALRSFNLTKVLNAVNLESLPPKPRRKVEKIIANFPISNDDSSSLKSSQKHVDPSLRSPFKLSGVLDYANPI